MKIGPSGKKVEFCANRDEIHEIGSITMINNGLRCDEESKREKEKEGKVKCNTRQTQISASKIVELLTARKINKNPTLTQLFISLDSLSHSLSTYALV